MTVQISAHGAAGIVIDRIGGKSTVIYVDDELYQRDGGEEFAGTMATLACNDILKPPDCDRVTIQRLRLVDR